MPGGPLGRSLGASKSSFKAWGAQGRGGHFRGEEGLLWVLECHLGEMGGHSRL